MGKILSKSPSNAVIIDAYVRFANHIPFLPASERSLIRYYYEQGLNQKEIASIMGVTQGAVSSKLSKAWRRLDFISKLNQYDLSNINKDLGGLFGPLEMEILKTMAETTCQTQTACRLNEMFNLIGAKRLNQIKVKYRYEKCLEVLAGYPHLNKYLELFKLINENLYMLNEVKLPHFDRSLERE